MTKQKSDKVLFRTQETNSKDFVILNWHGEPIKEFSLYAEAYHCAAKELISSYGTTGAMRDFEAAPVLFLYRHSFELYLKAFVLVGSKILRLYKKTYMSPKDILGSHKLTDFLPDFEAIIKEVGWTWDLGVEGLKKKSDFVNLVKEFDSIDPGSYSFRYPTDKRGMSPFNGRLSFNLSLFAKRIDPLLEVLDGALSGLSECWNLAAEAAYEAQQNI